MVKWKEKSAQLACDAENNVTALVTPTQSREHLLPIRLHKHYYSAVYVVRLNDTNVMSCDRCRRATASVSRLLQGAAHVMVLRLQGLLVLNDSSALHM